MYPITLGIIHSVDFVRLHMSKIKYVFFFNFYFKHEMMDEVQNTGNFKTVERAESAGPARSGPA